MTDAVRTVTLAGGQWALVVVTAEHVPEAVRVMASGEIDVDRAIAVVAPGECELLAAVVRAGFPVVLDAVPDADALRRIDENLTRRGTHVAPALGPDLLVVAQRFAHEAAPRLDLTRREREILELVAGGMSNRAVASALFVSEHTVRNHLSRTFRKLGVTTRAAASDALMAEGGRYEAAQDGSPQAPKH